MHLANAAGFVGPLIANDSNADVGFLWSCFLHQCRTREKRKPLLVPKWYFRVKGTRKKAFVFAESLKKKVKVKMAHFET